MLNHRNKMDTSIAIDVTTAMNMKSDRDTVISSYISLVVSGGGDPPIGMQHLSVTPSNKNFKQLYFQSPLDSVQKREI